MKTVLLVLVTFPNAEKARQIGTTMIELQLAACVNLVPGVKSIYRWQGKVETGQEVLAIFKTTEETWAAFEVQMQELHPYDVPEMVALKPAQVSTAYAQWVVESVEA